MPAIRPERAAERDAIRRLNQSAFGGPAEADLVDALRGSPDWIPELSLVAADGDELVGHVLFSVVALDSGPELLSLGPMAVGMRYPLVVVLGHPEYYPRFGFAPARGVGIDTPYEAPDEAWMALPLGDSGERVRGTVRYPPAWSGV